MRTAVEGSPVGIDHLGLQHDTPVSGRPVVQADVQIGRLVWGMGRSIQGHAQIQVVVFPVQARHPIDDLPAGVRNGDVHDVLAAGQIEGGVAQGIGWALLEDVVWEGGRMKNATMTDYIVPTSMDTPPIRVVFLEHPHGRAPHGAKGIGELPMDGPAPAIVNAVRQAVGVRLRHVPATPERIFEALRSSPERNS